MAPAQTSVPGRRADVAVVDSNPLTVVPRQVLQANVDLAMADARIVVERKTG